MVPLCPCSAVSSPCLRVMRSDLAPLCGQPPTTPSAITWFWIPPTYWNRCSCQTSENHVPVADRNRRMYCPECEGRQNAGKREIDNRVFCAQEIRGYVWEFPRLVHSSTRPRRLSPRRTLVFPRTS